VIVATDPEAVSVPVHSEAEGSVTAAPDVKPKADAKVTVIVFPEARAPKEEGVKPTVQVAVDPEVCGLPENVTADTAEVTLKLCSGVDVEVV
jgi:hypothetical protein